MSRGDDARTLIVADMVQKDMIIGNFVLKLYFD
jgi:hypothetical protein